MHNAQLRKGRAGRRWTAAAAAWVVAAGTLLGSAGDAWALYARGGFNGWGGWAMSQNGNFWESPVNNKATATSSEGLKFDNNNNWGKSWGTGTAASKNSTIGTATLNGGNLTLSATKDKYYYFRVAGTDDWNDRRYAVFETTSYPLRTISSQSQSAFTWSSSKYNITITATLSGTIATEQKVYIRYTTDDWSTSSYGTMTKSGSTATYTFSDATASKTYKYYILTTTFDTSKLTSDTIYSSPNNTTAYDFLVYSALNNSGNNYSFTTPNWSAPSAGTPSAGTPTVSGATVTLGSINAHGAATTVSFEYGEDTDYGTSVTPGTTTISASTTSGSSSATLTGLLPATTYCYKWTLVNVMGTTTKTGTFTTASPGAGELVDWLSSAASGAWVNATTFPWYYNTSDVNWKNVTDFGEQHVRINNDNQTAQTLSANTAVKSLTYGSYATTAHTLSGNYTLTINGGLTNAAAATHTISSAVTLGANTIADVTSASGGLTLSGTVGGSKTLTKQGDGTLTLSGTNTYTGDTTISGGTVSITAANALGTTAGKTTVSTGGKLQLNPSAATVFGEPLVLNGGTLQNSFNGNSITNCTVQLPATSTVTADSSQHLHIGSAITGTGGLTKKGAGYLYLYGANTYSGTTTVSEGRLYIYGTIAGPLAANANYTYFYNVGSTTKNYDKTISGSKTIYKTGSNNNGILNLSGNNTFTGPWQISRGTLVASSTTALGSASATSAITISGANLSLLRFAVDGITLSRTVTWSSTATTQNSGFSVDDGMTATLNGVISGSGTGPLNKTGAGTLVMGAANTYTADTAVKAGTLKLTGTAASSAFTVSGGTLEAGAANRTVKSLTMTSGGIKASTANTFSSSAGAADLTDGTIYFDASGWTKAGTTQSWTIFAGGAAATCSGVTLSVTAATGTTASEYTVAASGNNIVVTWTKTTTAPTLEDTPTAADIAPTSATLGGKVTADGNLTISEYGVVWGTSADPTIASHTGGGQVSTSGAPTVGTAFTFGAADGVTGLTPGATYHFRAYATNSKGTSYSDDATFTAPTVVGLSKVTFTYPGAGNTLTLTGTGGSESGAYSYKVQSTSGSAEGSIATGSDQLSVTACGTTSATGSFTIRVTKAADAPYASQYADVVVTVNKAAQTVTFSPASPVFGADVTSYTVTASVLGGATVTYSSGTTAAATINSSSGKMARGTTGYGSTVVTATVAESANYLSKTATVTVKVMGKRPTSNPATLTFTATGTGSMTINFKQASDSTGIVLVMKAGGAPTTAPTDGSLPKTSAISGNATTFGESPAAGSAANGYVIYANTGGTGASGYTLTVNGLTAGTQYYVTAYPYKGGSGTYAYKNSSLTTINGYTLADPVTTASATADGKTMVRLSWSKPSGASGTMVVWEGTTEPTQGTTYSVGATTLGGKVLYRSTGSSPTLEHVVPAGATYTYKFYAYSSANAYSEALERTAAMGSFGSGEIVDTFSYTNGASLSGLNGANGWTNAWSISGTGPTIVSQTGSSIPVFTNYTEYPGNTGNRMKVAMNSDAANFAATRGFPAVSSGTIYAAAIMSYHYAGNKKWCRIALQDGDTAKMAAGRIWESGDDRTIGIDDCNGGRTHGSYNLNPWEDSNDNDYLVIMKYDFSTKTISARAYYHGEAVPSEAPTTWHVTKTLSANPARLNKVSLQAGSDAGGYTGDVYFDEVRVATSWSKLLQQEAVAPNPPTSVTATADGNEMVRVGWTKNAAGNGVMVLATTDGTTPAAPTAGTAYSQGATVGGTTKVAYKGTGTGADLVVAPGTTVKVAVYSYNGDNLYSTAETPAAVTTGTYESWENLETMSYTNGVQVSASGNSWKGGQVWGDNYWGSRGSGNWIPLKPAEVPGYLVNHVVNYPDSVGNVMCVTNLGDGQNATLDRVVSPSVGGRYNDTVFFAYRMAYRYSESGKNRWAGLQLVSSVGGAEKTVFVGKAAATDHQYHLGINATGASSPCWPDVGSGGNAYELKGTYDYEKSAYVVVGKIQWTADNVANVFANAFYTGDGDAELPENEPSWGSFGYNGASMGPIDSIQFIAGADSGHGQIGFAYFDELRWGTSWEQLLSGKAPTDVWMDGQTTYVYAGDTVTNAITSTPKGAKQSAQSLIWETASPVSATWEANAIPAAFYTNKESDTQTEWHGLHLITNKTAVTRYGLGAVSGNGTTVKSQNHGEATYQKHTYSVKVLPAPTLSSVTGGDFKETIRWTRATGYNSTGSSSSGRTFSEVMVVRYSSQAASTAALPPVDGKTYFPGDVIYYNNDPTDSKYMTVVYRGSDATSYVDAGLAKNTKYYYAVFTVNNSYYSAKSTVKSATTTGTSTTPVVDGLTTDWVGGASPTKNSAAYSEEEFIWTDKALEGRKDTDACRFADIGEFRIKATASTVYFLLRLTNSTATSVRPTNTYVVVGVDTRRNASSTAMNWLGDESATFVGGGYYQTNAAIHYPERQMAVHYVGGSENHWQVEMYADNGADWYAPQNGDWAAACSADNSTDPCIEWSVPREDLGLTGAGIGRFTIATFVNSGVWNNQGVGTVRIEHDSCAAVDAAEIVPYGVNDQDGLLGAWDEGLKNGNVNFWADVRFTAAGLATHTAPTVPASTGTGTNGPGSPLLQWTASTDTDGFVTGYLLEVATNAAFGTLGDSLLYRVNLEGASTTSFKTRTSVSNFYWRVRARDSAGILSSAVANPYTVEGRKDNDGPVAKLLYVGTNVMAFINNTGGYRDDQERSGDATSVEDRDLRDGGKVFGFVIEWYDVNGVYATNVNRNTGGFAWNILAEHSGGEPYGRVSPNWDLLIIDRKTPAGTAPSPETVDGNPKPYSWKEGLVLPTENGGTETIDCWYIDCGKDAVFTNDYGVTQVINDGNFGQYVTNYVTNAFTFGGYRDGVELYLTVSAEDGNLDTGNEETSGDKGWWPWPYWVDGSAGSYGDDPRPTVNSSGHCKDGPHKARNVTTNQLLKFYVRDNDVRPPVASTNLWGADATDASGAKFTPSLVVATSAVTKAQASGAWGGIPGKVAPISGAGRDTVYQLTDQALGRNLTFLFNAYDEYLHSGLQLGNTRTATVSKRILTNTTAMVRTWDAESGEWAASDENWAAYKSALSTIYDINPTTGAEAVGTAGTGPDTVLVWDFGTLTEGNIDSLFGVNNILSYISTNSAGTTNLVQLHLRDRDNDRDGDQADTELTFGRMMFTDDDATPPTSPGYALLGSGTNYVDFGALASWEWSTSGKPTSWSTNTGLKGIDATEMSAWSVGSSSDTAITGSSVKWTERSSSVPAGQDWSAMSRRYMSLEGGMQGATYQSADGAKYFQFDVCGENGARWTADTLQFDNRVTAKGPTLYTLTVQEAANVTTLAAVTADGQKDPAWTVAGGVFEKANGILRFTLENAGGTASLASPSFQPNSNGRAMTRVQYRVGRIGAVKDGATLTVGYRIGSGTRTVVKTHASSDFTDSAANKFANYEVVSFDLPTDQAGNFTVTWEASGINGSQGFLLTDVSVVMQNSFNTEHPLVQDLLVEKAVDSSTDGSQETIKNVVMSWAGTENAEGTTWRYRLYAYGADGTGNWGINKIKLLGITMSPRGMDVTDGDLRHATWVNSLEVVDGEKAGWDTEKSGLWLTGDNAPAYVISYPEADAAGRAGTAVASGTFAFKDGKIRKAAYSVLPDGTFEADPTAWTLSGATIEAGSGTRARVLKLAGGDSAVSSATKGFDISLGSIAAADVSGVTVSGGFEAKASVAEGSGGVNGLSVTVRLKDAGGNVLLAKTFEYAPVAAWRQLEIGPWTADNALVRKAEAEIAQTTAAGTELLVANVALQLATWGAPTGDFDNGEPGAKLELQTQEVAAGKTLKLSSELTGEGSKEYVLASTVHDYDRDRTDDALAVTIATGFELYDDDTQAPSLGAKFGGPVGMRLGNRSGLPYNASGTDVQVVVTDQQMDAAKRDGQSLAYLDIDGYDQSGWTTAALTLNYTEGGSAKSLAYDGADVTEGAAGLPSATNTFHYDLSTLWANTFVKSQFAAFTANMTVNATLTDQDDDRADDSLDTVSQLGFLKFMDNDTTAPAMRTSGSLKGMFIATNPPGGSITTALSGVSNASWAAKSTYEVRKLTDSDTASERVQLIYDGELSSGRPFYLMANVGDALQSGTGVSISGLQRGNVVSRSIKNGFNDTIAVSNTTMVLSNSATIVTNLATHFNEGYSSAFKTTRAGTATAPQTWYWPTGMTTNEVGFLLPAESTFLDFRVLVEAFDCDTNRPSDQAHARLEGPTLRIRDDDTTPPNPPAQVWVNDELVASGSIDRNTAPWQKSLSSVKVEWTEALDPEPAGFGTAGNDIKVAGIAGYWLADPGATPGVGDATALTDTTTNASTHKVSKTLTGLTILQGCGNYQLFAVDADADRAGDALAGSAANVPLALDYTKPTLVPLTGHGTGASTDGVDDPTTQMDISWTATGVGPDDTGDPNYADIPTAEKTAAAAQGRAVTDILSPWLTYKVYYREYDPQAVETQAASESKSAAQIILRDYVQAASFGTEAAGWLAVTNDAPIADPSAGKTKYDTLGTNVTSSVRVYDLDFDREYLFVVVGVDKAGNEGPVNDASWATNNTIKFAVTQGLIRASADINYAISTTSIEGTNSVGMAQIKGTDAPKKGAVLYWMAAGMKDGVGKVSKYYDLIYRDAASFNELGTEQWNMASTGDNTGTSKTNWNYQADAGLDTPNRLRFYRASYAGRWQGSYPLASEEVYSMNNIVLSEGFNYVSLQGVPYTNTFAAVFGTDTNMWPVAAGNSPTASGEAVKIQFFATNTAEKVDDWYFFGQDGGVYKWFDQTGADVTGIQQRDGFFARPFSIVLPNANITTNAQGQVETNGWWKTHSDYEGATHGIDAKSRELKAMLWHPILQVPTNSPQASAQTITKAAGTYNLLSLNLPVAVHPRDLGLTGIHKSVNPWDADKLYVVDTETKEVRNGSMMYCEPDGTWKWVKNQAKVDGWPILPNDMLVLVSSGNAASDWTWTYSPTNFYKLPDRHMGRPAPTTTGGP